MKTTTNQSSSALYEQMGIAALLPGMQRAYEALGKEIEQMRERLGILQSPPRRGRPPISREAEQRQNAALRIEVDEKSEHFKRQSSGSKNYWAAMTPQQRKKEMARRVAVGIAKRAAGKKNTKIAAVKELPKKGKVRIYDPAHPGNAAWLKKMSKIAKKRWASLPKGANTLGGITKRVQHVNGVAA